MIDVSCSSLTVEMSVLCLKYGLGRTGGDEKEESAVKFGEARNYISKIHIIPINSRARALSKQRTVEIELEVN